MNKTIGLLVTYVLALASLVSQSPADFAVAAGDGMNRELAAAVEQPVNVTVGYARATQLMEDLKDEEYVISAKEDGEFSMSKLIELLVTWMSLMVMSVLSQSPKELINAVTGEIQKEIVAVKSPVEETIVKAASSQCTNVKKLFGISYEQLQGEKEPDVNGLTIVFKTRAVTAIMNITQAPQSLRRARSFQKDKRFIMYIHGFTDDPTKDSFTNLSQSLLEKETASVIALDCSSLIKWWYLRSTTLIQYIGHKLGQVLASVFFGGVSPSRIHLIGHSLGAHIAAFAGKTFFNLTGQRVGRISGMDPAGPCFTHVDPDLRLKKTDAAFVDVTHTDAGVYGMREPLGHVDFYPNSGSQQPNCLFETCSHSRAWLLFGESVLNEEAFPAVKCKDWEAFRKGQCENKISFMGYPAKPGTTGLYYLQTNGQFSYGRGVNGTKYVNEEAVITNIGNLLG